jgi:CRP-like cAMP-binding protein
MIIIMFQDLDPFLKDLKRRQLAFEPGETVFRQDDPVRQVFFVTAGAIDLVRHQASGASLVLQHAGPNTILAEASIDSAMYHCAAIAVSNSTAWAISKRDFLNRLTQSPMLALALIRRLTHELQNARFHTEVLSMKTVAERLDAWIAWRGYLPAKGQRVRLAAELGVSPESLYREIARRN